VTVVASMSAFVDMSPLHPAGPVSNHINDVFWPLFWVSVAVTGMVSLTILYSAVRFRRKHDDEEPAQTHGNNKLEIGWTVVPFLILSSLFVLTAANMGVIASTPDGAMKVKVTGVRFYWQFDYGIKKANGKELTTIKDFYIPVGRPVALDVESIDVNHSLFMPNIDGQINAIPGQTNHIWFQIDRPGDYTGQCTELCGDGHWSMDLIVHAMSQSDFDAWEAKQTGGSSASAGGPGAGGQ
jgi:cytochrome c oxidase subunit II